MEVVRYLRENMAISRIALYTWNRTVLHVTR